MNCADLGIPTSSINGKCGLPISRNNYSRVRIKQRLKSCYILWNRKQRGRWVCHCPTSCESRNFCFSHSLGDPDKIRTEEARLNWKIINKLSLKIRIEIMYDSALRIKFREEIESSNVIIDCLLGTGVKGTIREPIATAITLINSSSLPKIAIDVPSGMDPNTGEIPT